MSSGKINAKKKQLMKKYKKALDDKDPNGIGDMQKELLDYSEEILKDDPSMDMFDSGAKGSYGNNFKIKSCGIGSNSLIFILNSKISS